MTHTLITGASGGLGAALARACARPGAVLHLGGRDVPRLAAVAQACRGLGAEVHPVRCDVTDCAATAAWVRGAGPLDLVIANAGISAGTGRGEPEPEAQVRAVLETNLTGMLNTVLPAIEVIAAQPAGPEGVRGRVAVVASLAALLPVPGAPAYAASKAAVDAWAVASAPALARRGVLVTSVCPGYVRTPMTAANRFPMPGLMDADRAATIILRGVARGRVRVAFPWWVAAAARAGGAMPASWLLRAMRDVGGK